MNSFPLFPFLASLPAGDIRITPQDYSRIGLVLKTGGKWTITRLRDILLALLVKSQEQEDIFLRRFSMFFKADADIERAFADVDLKKVLGEKIETPKAEKQEKPIEKDRVVEETSEVEKTENHKQDRIVEGKSEDTSENRIKDQTIEERSDNKTSENQNFEEVSGERSFGDQSDDENKPRLFSLGAIGGNPAPILDDETLNRLADSMGYFNSEHCGKVLNIPESVKKTACHTGIPVLDFHKRKEIRSLLILEDAFAEGTLWNPIARELSEGMTLRGIPVLYGRFFGSPEQFETQDGSHYHLEDLEDERRGFVLLIFTDGRNLHRDRIGFFLEAIARWHAVAWMEFREPMFWDESSALPVRFGIPIYPASSAGLMMAITRFLTEQSIRSDFSEKVMAPQQMPDQSGMKFDAFIEMLLGDALLWAQDCAMRQPITHGMADALRREFHSHLPYQSMGRLYAMPGTTPSISGLRFSDEVLKVLRQGFLSRRDEAEQEAVLKFIQTHIEKVKPSEMNSMAYLAWEVVRERGRLELGKEFDFTRLEELTQTALGDSIYSEFENHGILEDKDKIPIRFNLSNKQGLKRLSRLLHRKIRMYWLRKEPMTVSDKEFKKIFGLDENRRTLQYIENDFRDNGDGTITDQATGLMWQKSGSDNYLYLKDVPAYIEKLNREKFAGFSDWRLPTVDELESLLTAKKMNGGLYIAPIFDDTQRWCWTSDKSASGGAWSVLFNSGIVDWLSSNLYVRAVRSCISGDDIPKEKDEIPLQKYWLRKEPVTVSDKEASGVFKLRDKEGWWIPLEYVENDFKDNEDGTITDHATGLMWQKSGSPDYMNLKDVPAYIEKLNSEKFAGYDDWRLPTVDELKSLLTQESNDRYINPIFDSKQWWCWTSDKRASDGAWLVVFYDGCVSWRSIDLGSYVRAVRSIQ